MKDFISLDFGVSLSTSTISDKLIGMLYTVKQVRVEPQTCNNDTNKTKRKQFAEDLRQHMRDGDFIVYYDETNFNVYCKRSQGVLKGVSGRRLCCPLLRAPISRSSVPSPTEVGLVHHQLERGSIRMDVNAAFVDEIYENVKASATYREHFKGKKIVMILDNAHSQTKDRVVEHDDLVLLRLAPYSPMCNPIEGCFSVLKAKIETDIALSREELVAARPRGQIAEGRMQVLEDAARRCIGCSVLQDLHTTLGPPTG